MSSCCNDGPLPIPGEEYPRDRLTGLLSDNYATGEKKEESLYLDGWKNGLSTYWYPNGTKRSEGSFEKGKKTGVWYSWYEDGAVEE
jgi:antitoxin component YwqK of YwqJK toxin-antitoxin module